ncbi:MAG: hypothetical protein BWX86_02546 [Verrucomicrobia bacterium ADurb.Bin122]|nr:MAG: hypothetical protein BWX86_02546 [Verrucomicrobia bacterium ADurb.Bin122]
MSRHLRRQPKAECDQPEQAARTDPLPACDRQASERTQPHRRQHDGNRCKHARCLRKQRQHDRQRRQPPPPPAGRAGQPAENRQHRESVDQIALGLESPQRVLPAARRRKHRDRQHHQRAPGHASQPAHQRAQKQDGRERIEQRIDDHLPPRRPLAKCDQQKQIENPGEHDAVLVVRRPKDVPVKTAIEPWAVEPQPLPLPLVPEGNRRAPSIHQPEPQKQHRPEKCHQHAAPRSGRRMDLYLRSAGCHGRHSLRLRQRTKVISRICTSSQNDQFSM